MGQAWVDLAFLHWAVPPERVQPWMPPGVRPDVVVGADGRARTYVALVPFRMVGAGLGNGPAVPWLGTFWETNVRLYSVDATGRRGVVFCSLDASRLAVVLGARAAFSLPYRWARMRGAERVRDGARELAWTARTRWPGPRGLSSRVAVRVGEPIADDAPDAGLAAFLTARWGLHTAYLRRTWYVPNEHGAWPLRRAEVLALDDGLLGAAGFGDLAQRPPDHVAFAERVGVRFGLPGSARRPRRG
ncbi:YqjF family protein [Pseudokineococcus basanitobsidens]